MTETKWHRHTHDGRQYHLLWAVRELKEVARVFRHPFSRGWKAVVKGSDDIRLALIHYPTLRAAKAEVEAMVAQQQ